MTLRPAEFDALVEALRREDAGFAVPGADPRDRADFRARTLEHLRSAGYSYSEEQIFPLDWNHGAAGLSPASQGRRERASGGSSSDKTSHRVETSGKAEGKGQTAEPEGADPAGSSRQRPPAGAEGSSPDDEDGPPETEEEKKKRERFRATMRQRLRLAIHDDGLGDRVVALCRERDVRFCSALATDQSGRSGWLFYERGVYRLDEDKAILRLAREAAERIEDFEMAQYEGKDREALLHFAVQARSQKARSASLQAAHVDKRLQTWVAQLDNEPYFLNLRNGTLDLRSGELLAHSPERLLTKQLPFDYDPDAPCPRWLDFLLYAFGAPPAEVREGLSDEQWEEQVAPAQEMVDFVARCVGYSLSGDVKAQVWFSCVGEGQNGKSTFFDVLRALCGDPANLVKLYALDRSGGAYSPPPSSFVGNLPKEHLVRGQGNQASERERMLYELRGARLAIAVEMNQGEQLDEAFLKQLTGGETVTARRLYQQPFSYHPQFKVWLGTNYLPVIRAGGKATFRRIIPIPWDVVVPEERRDLDLLERLLDEVPGILAWAVRGFRDFWERRRSEDPLTRKDPLGLPPPVVLLRRRYEEKSDLLGQFIAECLETEYPDPLGSGEIVPLPPSSSVPLKELVPVWEQWAREQGIRHPMGRNKLAEALQQPPYRLHYDRLQTGGYCFRGCALREEWSSVGGGRP